MCRCCTPVKGTGLQYQPSGVKLLKLTYLTACVLHSLVPCRGRWLPYCVPSTMPSQSGTLMPARPLTLDTLTNLPAFFYSCRYRQCQLQDGSADCGLFALAFAAVLAAGGHPSAYLFHQQAMRKHLHQCLTMNRFSPFPTRRIGRENRKAARISQPVLCVLHLQDACKFWQPDDSMWKVP